MRASLIAQLVKNPPALQETPVWFLGREDPLERDRLPTPVFLGFPCGSAGKESTCNVGDLGSISGEGKGYPVQYAGLESAMDCIVHGVKKSQTGLSDFHFTFTFQELRFKERDVKGMAPASLGLASVCGPQTLMLDHIISPLLCCTY